MSIRAQMTDPELNGLLTRWQNQNKRKQAQISRVRRPCTNTAHQRFDSLLKYFLARSVAPRSMINTSRIHLQSITSSASSVCFLIFRLIINSQIRPMTRHLTFIFVSSMTSSVVVFPRHYQRHSRPGSSASERPNPFGEEFAVWLENSCRVELRPSARLPNNLFRHLRKSTRRLARDKGKVEICVRLSILINIVHEKSGSFLPAWTFIDPFLGCVCQ